jgi:hypothetical protein
MLRIHLVFGGFGPAAGFVTSSGALNLFVKTDRSEAKHGYIFNL